MSALSPSNTGTAASWSFSEPLVEGDNALTYTATDNVTQTGTDSITVTLDTIDPVVTITSATTSSTASYTITGTATDIGGTGVASVACNLGSVTGTSSFSGSATLSSGANTITCTATDNATNTGSSSISVTYTPDDPGDDDNDDPDTCDLSAPTIQDCGDLAWGTFIITSPNGGENYLTGSGTSAVTTTNITWTYSPGTYTGTKVKLLYSTDGGSTYPNTITASTPISPASYTWTLPTSLKNTTLKVKGIVLDSNDAQTGEDDASDANFEIHANSAPGIAI